MGISKINEEPAVRLIHKYSNRRLYDKAESRYVTLEDIRSLVLNGEEFVVRDWRSHVDLTRSILLQILVVGEDAAGSRPVLDEKFLIKTIQMQSSSQAQTLEHLSERQESLDSRRDAVEGSATVRVSPAI